MRPHRPRRRRSPSPSTSSPSSRSPSAPGGSGMSSNPAPGSGESRPADAEYEQITRTFGWQNMFVSPEDDPRSDDGLGDERTTLTGYLRAYRLTLELKCSGLDAAGLARRSVPPSNLSLLGLVRHLTDVGRHWFRRALDGQDIGWVYGGTTTATPLSTRPWPTRRWCRPPGPPGG